MFYAFNPINAIECSREAQACVLFRVEPVAQAKACGYKNLLTPTHLQKFNTLCPDLSDNLSGRFVYFG
jgi:hypothetical protein